MPEDQPTRILVFGDRVRDEYILPLARRGGYGENEGINEDWKNHDQWIPMSRDGGVQMTADMLRWFFAKDEVVVAKIRTSTPALKSLARLGDCKLCKDTGRPESFRTAQVASKNVPEDLKLRVSDFQGYHGVARDVSQSEISIELEQPRERPDAIVINDAGTDLRRSACEDQNAFLAAMNGLPENSGTDVILKMHLPLAEELAWTAFRDAVGSARTRVVIVGASDLRLHYSGETTQAGAPIARCPSWDRVVEDLRAGVAARHGLLKTLVEGSDALIVLFDVEGAAILEGTSPDALKITLVFDPMRAEGEMAHLLPGDMVGKMNCFLASFTNTYLRPPDEKRETLLAAAVTDAIIDARLYAESCFTVETDSEGKLQPGYPAVRSLRQDYEAQLQGTPEGHALPVYVQLSPKLSAPCDETGNKTSRPQHPPVQLLADAVEETRAPGESEKTFEQLAHKIVSEGIEKTLKNLPHGRFGDLWTVDREEIEGLRAVNTLIQSYLDDQSDSKPLSIAVFGPPGAGKSFGVKQLVDKDKTPVLEFNLSQVGEEQLPGFFHMIRDCNLENKTPLCFFDEFDSRNLSLLKNFLAPMQDGQFLEGQTLRPVGRGIFVFAGGTCDTLDEFEFGLGNQPFPQDTKGPEEKSGLEDFEAARKLAKETKKADFISRLRGSYDVKGPNPRNEHDHAYFLRRAILLRRLLERHLDGIISQVDKRASIEPELLTALIGVDAYRHGSRSMELLVRALARGHAGASVGRSDLPIDGQIGMLVDLDSWRELLAGPAG
ncbi:hypothetical protein WNZ15_00075 [Roseibium sp. AS2]|uniref:hypothetical protein n=1 Tax=Roseibium sp. AS2 TaxID=3135781 RepID=UPI00316BE5E9